MFGITGKLWQVRLLVLALAVAAFLAFAAGVMGGWKAMSDVQALQDQKAAKAQAAPKR